MASLAAPPKAYSAFITRFPKLAEAWQLLRQAGESGPLDQRSVHLVKLAVAIGSMREGAVHSAVRKALSAGATREEIDQVVALAASNIGLPSAVAVSTWVQDCFGA